MVMIYPVLKEVRILLDKIKCQKNHCFQVLLINNLDYHQIQEYYHHQLIMLKIIDILHNQIHIEIHNIIQKFIIKTLINHKLNHIK
jgi:hypothetical protein